MQLILWVNQIFIQYSLILLNKNSRSFLERFSFLRTYNLSLLEKLDWKWKFIKSYEIS